MTRGVLAVVLVAIVAGCGTTKTVTRTVTAPQKSLKQFGYIRSLTRKGDRFVMRFDPAQFLTGEAANVAAAQDGAVDPGQPVPNDSYVVNESERTYTYFVAPDARVTVLRDGVDGSPITLAQLAELVAGGNPFGKPLFEPLVTGFWMTYEIDTVHRLDQQYHP
jgi:hypothetical protein